MASFAPGLRRLALKASPSLFVCRQCQRQQPQWRSSSSRILDIVRSQQQQQTRCFNQTKAPLSFSSNAVVDKTSPIIQQATEAAKDTVKNSAWPETNSKSVAYWLLGSAVSVFGIVVWGGLTRLTESGYACTSTELSWSLTNTVISLSITEWRPVTGSMPPRNEADWESEFEKYRASPEFKLLNPHMTMDEFKKIYFMEWSHRLWGRFIGMSFVLPTLYFIARRRVTPKMALNLCGISCLIGFQGFIGWWMVKSGLKDDLFAPGSHPRVSQYRLTAHLATAFVCYSWMLMTALSIFRTRRLLADPVAASKALAALQNPAIKTFRRLSFALVALVFTTAMSGALVAGLDAGLIYNEFPYMGLGLTPPAKELWDKFYSRKDDGSDLWWRNMLENPSTVQLDHRILAMTTLTAILSLFAYSRTGRVAAALPKDVKKGVLGTVHLVLLQATLGISTLIYIVPTHLAATHQAGALALLTGALVLGHRLRVPKSTLAMVQKRIKAMNIKP
ncbi:hypothetical protein COL154_001638 [Colletotrichum chrysophilum]|nr:hypothetical protein COL154_001638 [Colletotrichum chrysophilum]